MGLQFHTKITNGAIELPESVRHAIRNDTDFLVTLEVEIPYEANSILQSLCENPLKTNSTKPLSRNEANERR